MLTLRLYNLAEAARATGYHRTTIEKFLGADLADGTPGRRFPLPLKPVGGRRREWDASSISRWIEGRKQ